MLIEDKKKEEKSMLQNYFLVWNTKKNETTKQQLQYSSKFLQFYSIHNNLEKF